MRKKRILIIFTCLLCVIITIAPMFHPNEGVCLNPITRRMFHISTEDDVEIVLDGGAASWYVELTGEEREKAIKIINNMRFYFWVPSHQLFFPTGGWEQCFRVVYPDKRYMYVISNGRVEVGYLTVFGYTKEMMELIDQYRPG